MKAHTPLGVRARVHTHTNKYSINAQTDRGWNSTCSHSGQTQKPPRNGIGRGKREQRWESGSNACSASRKPREWHRLFSHTRNPSPTPHAEADLTLHADKQAGGGAGGQQSVCTPPREGCSETRLHPGCGHACVRGHPPPHASLPSACVPPGCAA